MAESRNEVMPALERMKGKRFWNELDLIRLKGQSELQWLKKDHGLQNYYKILGPREVSHLLKVWDHDEEFGFRG